jgi:hypothetical protein
MEPEKLTDLASPDASLDANDGLERWQYTRCLFRNNITELGGKGWELATVTYEFVKNKSVTDPAPDVTFAVAPDHRPDLAAA